MQNAQKDPVFSLTGNVSRRVSISVLGSLCVVAVCAGLVVPPSISWGREFSRDELLQIVLTGRRQLIERQLENGAFPADGFLTHPLGTTCLATLALIKTGSRINDPPVASALKHIRSQPWEDVSRTHEVALGIIVLGVAGNPDDLPLMERLTQKLLAAQTVGGGWTHRAGDPDGDLSISCFALLGLREAARAGIPVPQSAWEKIRSYWTTLQNADGGWFDFATDRSAVTGLLETGSSTLTATLAGTMALSTCDEMQSEQVSLSTETSSGSPHSDEALQRGLAWFTPRNVSNPEFHTSEALVAFHLYGLELCNRLRHPLFPGERQWFREGVSALLSAWNPRSGMWEGTNDIIATSHALLFLSGEIEPALVNSIAFRDSNGIARPASFPHAMWNLTEGIVRLKGWPRWLTSRELELSLPAEHRGVGQHPLMDAPVLLITHDGAPELSNDEAAGLKAYLQQGGVLFASPSGDQAAFERGFLNLLDKLFLPGEVKLLRLPADHPVYHAQYSLSPNEVELFGVETGCRTAILYCRENLSSRWESAMPPLQAQPETGMPAELELALKIGINVVAFAAGDQPPQLPAPAEFVRFHAGQLDSMEEDRSRVRVAHVIQGKDWNVAPGALHTLLKAVNAAHGPIMATHARPVSLDSPELFDQMLLFLHGGNNFTLTEEESRLLRLHLQQGGVLFADACCGSAEFDAGFRQMVRTLFPDQPLRPVPLNHRLFSVRPGFHLDRVKLRTAQRDGPDAHVQMKIEETAPWLEGVEIDGRLAIIYSKYDLSCAMGDAAGSHCEGYLPDDALRIGMNIIMYGLLQEARPGE